MNLLAALFVLISPEIVDNLDYYGYPLNPPPSTEIQTGIGLPEEDADLVRANVQVRELVTCDALQKLRFAELRRKLDQAKGAYATAKAPLRFESAVTTIGFMEDVHTILKHNLNGYTFKRGKLKGATVTNVTDEVIVATPAVANTWPMFYRLYKANLGEAMDRFILHGDVYGDPVLAGNQHVHALVGVAFMMGTMYPGDPTAAVFRERYVRAAAKASPYGLRLAVGMFPDVNLKDVLQPPDRPTSSSPSP